MPLKPPPAPHSLWGTHPGTSCNVGLTCHYLHCTCSSSMTLVYGVKFSQSLWVFFFFFFFFHWVRGSYCITFSYRQCTTRITQTTSELCSLTVPLLHKGFNEHLQLARHQDMCWGPGRKKTLGGAGRLWVAEKRPPEMSSSQPLEPVTMPPSTLKGLCRCD